MDNIKQAAELGRSIIAEHLIQGGPGDPDALELAATLCNFAPAMLEALRSCAAFFASDPNKAKDGWMADTARGVAAILARIDGETVCASCGAPEGGSHGQKCEARAFAAGASIRRAES